MVAEERQRRRRRKLGDDGDAITEANNAAATVTNQPMRTDSWAAILSEQESGIRHLCSPCTTKLHLRGGGAISTFNR